MSECQCECCDHRPRMVTQVWDGDEGEKVTVKVLNLTGLVPLPVAPNAVERPR